MADDSDTDDAHLRLLKALGDAPRYWALPRGVGAENTESAIHRAIGLVSGELPGTPEERNIAAALIGTIEPLRLKSTGDFLENEYRAVVQSIRDKLMQQDAFKKLDENDRKKEIGKWLDRMSHAELRHREANGRAVPFDDAQMKLLVGQYVDLRVQMHERGSSRRPVLPSYDQLLNIMWS
jgi:hypothetical protein